MCRLYLKKGRLKRGADFLIKQPQAFWKYLLHVALWFACNPCKHLMISSRREYRTQSNPAISVFRAVPQLHNSFFAVRGCPLPVPEVSMLILCGGVLRFSLQKQKDSLHSFAAFCECASYIMDQMKKFFIESNNNAKRENECKVWCPIRSYVEFAFRIENVFARILMGEKVQEPKAFHVSNLFASLPLRPIANAVTRIQFFYHSCKESHLDSRQISPHRTFRE